MIKRGRELAIGDVIKVWWRPGRDVIVSLRPYQGTLTDLLGEGARIAGFGVNLTGMTIPAAAIFDVVDTHGEDDRQCE